MKISYVFRNFLIFCFTGFFIPQKINAQYDKLIWYDKPASYFEEAILLGNGKMGATVFGGIKSEKIWLNDATLWSGEPVNANNNDKASSYIPLIRKALKNENYQLADSLIKNVQGEFSQSYAPLGTLNIEFTHKDSIEDYRRELNLDNAISSLRYRVDDITYKREYFISNPDQLMLIKLSSNKEKSISCNINFESLLKYNISKKDSNTLKVSGYAPYHVEPSYRGDIQNPILFDSNKGTRFSNLIQIRNNEGTVKINENNIVIKGSSEVILLISIATSFNGFDRNPATEGKNNNSIAEKQLKDVNDISYDNIKSKHIHDYKKLFDRLELKIGKTKNTSTSKLPTDQRLMSYSDNDLIDYELELLYFNFARYLLISSSRTPEVPANLQGIWNPYIRPPWSSNYTLNINLEENYWLAETANLSELHLPLLQFINNLAKTGSVTAQTYYGVNGWTASQNSDIWAITNPVGDYGEGDPNWANWNMGGTWLATHLWEHYEFSKDLRYLKNYAFPLMKGAVEFCLNWMVKDKNGNWITSPSTSPEAKYITDKDYTGSTLYGATADLAMIKELLIDYIKASEVLGIHDKYLEHVISVKENLSPYKVGKKGNLQEWYHDWRDEDPQHRHQSHLFGLYPGNHITIDATPELAKAATKTLEIKGDETTGWSKGWRINLWARLQDGEHAYKMFRELLKYTDPDNYNGSHGGHGGTYPNLLDAHPPFQIDGNFGGAAAVLEMLIQSTSNEIYLLPALPNEWDKGHLKGVKTRGGFEVTMSWKDNSISEFKIYSSKGGKTNIHYRNKQYPIELEKGETLNINLNNKN